MCNFIESIEKRLKFQKELIGFNQEYINENPKAEHLKTYTKNIEISNSIINELELILQMSIFEYDKNS